MQRRTFLKAAAGSLAVAGAARGDDAMYEPLPLGVQWRMIEGGTDDAETAAIAKRAGFDGIEANPMENLAAAQDRGAACRAAGVPVHSITYGGWGAPMSSGDPNVIAKGHAEIENALRTAHAMECDTVLLVPAVVNAETRYADAYERSQQNIRAMLPLAEELGVVIAIENVWNNFLLSPIEFAQYIDDFESEWVQAYFDVGNVVAFGWPEDWIRTLGQRIRKVHWKDFKRDTREWTPLYEGSVDFAEVRKALDEIGFSGYGTAELPQGGEPALTEIARRMVNIGKGLPRP